MTLWLWLRFIIPSCWWWETYIIHVSTHLGNMHGRVNFSYHDQEKFHSCTHNFKWSTAIVKTYSTLSYSTLLWELFLLCSWETWRIYKKNIFTLYQELCNMCKKNKCNKEKNKNNLAKDLPSFSLSFRNNVHGYIYMQPLLIPNLPN